MTNPILAFSARRRMRSVRTAILLAAYSVAVLLFGIVLAFGGLTKSSLSIYSMRSGLEGYVYMMVFQFILLILVSPAITAGSIAGERERQTLEMLLVTNTGSMRIVWGKLLESLGTMLLLLIATLPGMSLTLMTGGVTFGQLMTGMAFLGLTAFACLSIGMLASSVFRRTVAATVMSYLFVFAVGFLTLLPATIAIMRASGEINMLSSSSIYYSSSLYVPTYSDTITGTELAGTLNAVMGAMALNPLVGLINLLAGQTGLLRSTLGTFSYTMYEMYDLLDFSTIALYSMGFLLALGVVMNLLAACFVRPRRVRIRKRKQK